MLGPPGIDGIFGSRTETAVKAFQRDKGLQVDGIVGPITWGAICASLNPSTAPSTFESEPQISYVTLSQQPQQQAPEPILPESASPLSEDPTADPGAEIGEFEEEGSDEATVKILSETLNETQMAQLISNTSAQVTPNASIGTENVTTIAQANETQPTGVNATLDQTSSPAPTFDQQLACADGTSPDPSTGLCADGSQPQPFNATASSPAPTFDQQLACADGTSPDPSTGLCADGSQAQPFNATASSPAPTFDQQLACADGTSP